MRDKLLLKVEDVAVLTSLSRSKIYQHLADKSLPSVTIGRSRRVRVEDLDRWLSAYGSQTADDYDPAPTRRLVSP